MRVKLVVVVVTYNSGAVIGDCLDSCRHIKTVVIDNASTDDTLEQVRLRPWADVIANAENRGFAAAVNQGVRQSDTEFVLLLNPDVQLRSDLAPLLAACGLEGTGMACGQLLDEGGRPQTGFSVRRLPGPAALTFEVLGLNRLFPWNPVNRKYRCLDLDPREPADVEQPAGAFLLFRKDVWKRLDGFDERFHPLWFEDVDFCKRILDLGLKIRYVPQVEAIHRGGHSISQLGWSRRERYWYVSLLKYASKHFRTSEFRGMSVAVVLGSLFRTIFAVFQKWSFEPCAVYAGVFRLGAECAFYGKVPQSAIGRFGREQ
jgi:N-acetylglucosaminyl-diphospho-decaprenol L-rhamnosyltransferase